MSRTRAVDVSIHAMSPDCIHSLDGDIKRKLMDMVYFIMNVEILDERVSARRNGFVVWDLSCIVESGQVDTVDHRRRHGQQSPRGTVEGTKVADIIIDDVYSTRTAEWMRR